MAKRTREVNIFNLSFLDVLSCGLGAVVTLLLLTQQMKAEMDLLQRKIPGALDQLRQVDIQAADARLEETRIKEALTILQAENMADQKTVEQVSRRIEELQQIRFIGVQTNRKHILILMDLSGSMNSHRPVLIHAARTLIGLLRNDDVKHRFNVLTFRSSEVGLPVLKAWRDGGELHDANDANKQAAQAWVESLVCNGETPTVAAFAEAFKHSQADCIFVLTDGEPTDGELSPELKRREPSDEARLDAVLRQIEKMNTRNVEIRCLGIGEHVYKRETLRTFLKRLCKDPKYGFVAL